MGKNYFRLAFIIVSTLCSSIVYGEVTLSTAVLERGEKILITFHHDNVSQMLEEACHFNLFAADSKRDLKHLPGKGLSIATFYRSNEEISIIAVELHKLSRNKMRRKSKRIYLRVLVPCEKGVTTQSEIYSVAVPARKRGKVKSLDRLIRRMKYHMRYATEEERLAASLSQNANP